ncbi:hypothetical protein [Lysinibacillus sp. 54212]|uniref:hypothetical protein n=1 Tax=Lysinibacillus sp. 54212 TaxID=3119829 RepID=UPI002FCB1BB9
MSFNHTTAWSNIWAQVKWKCAAYSTNFIILLAAQLMISIFAVNGTSSLYGGGSSVSMKIIFYSLDGLLMFSMVVIFILSVIHANYGMLKENFSVVTNRITASISTIIMLIILCIVGTLTAMSSFYIFTYIFLALRDGSSFIGETMLSFSTVLVFFAILVLASAGGFFIGSFTNLSKWIVGLAAMLMIVMIQMGTFAILDVTLRNKEQGIQPNYYILALVFIVVATFLYGLGTLLRNRKDVRV